MAIRGPRLYGPDDQRDAKSDIGGDEQRVRRTNPISDVTFKHILLPVWLAAYKYRGRTFRFVVNGRTGRVQGERPYSAWKIAPVDWTDSCTDCRICYR